MINKKKQTSIGESFLELLAQLTDAPSLHMIPEIMGISSTMCMPTQNIQVHKRKKPTVSFLS